MRALCSAHGTIAARVRARQRAAYTLGRKARVCHKPAAGFASSFGSYDGGVDEEEPDEAVASTLRAVRATGRQALGASRRLADTWAEALAVLLPTSVPRETVRAAGELGGGS
jgi:hypothetical protein